MGSSEVCDGEEECLPTNGLAVALQSDEEVECGIFYASRQSTSTKKKKPFFQIFDWWSKAGALSNPFKIYLPTWDERKHTGISTSFHR